MSATGRLSNAPLQPRERNHSTTKGRKNMTNTQSSVGLQAVVRPLTAEDRRQLLSLFKKKSILEACAYQGADIPKKWIKEMGFYYDGYNKAVEELRAEVEHFLSTLETTKAV